MAGTIIKHLAHISDGHHWRKYLDFSTNTNTNTNTHSSPTTHYTHFDPNEPDARAANTTCPNPYQREWR